MAHETGIPFGAYRLERRLARGGMAEVFLARQRGPEGWGRRVAVKRILPHLVEAEEFVNMFLDEARVAAQLSHPNVVHIYEFGKVEEYFFIAMEYVDGVDASQVMGAGRRAPVPPEIVARIGADAAAGLYHAHMLADAGGQPLGLVHRDISPQNLLVSYDGVVKIVDFGIAKATHQVERTRPGVVKGKFAYMSPEQVVGKSLDGRSDVFSLGLVLWELLAGRVAVSRDDPAEAMRVIRDAKLARIQDVRPDTPPALAAAIGRALHKDREQRPTAVELGLELEAYLKGSDRLATSMVVSQWVKAHFPRDLEASGPLPIVGPGTTPGTAPGTTPGTLAGTADAPLAPMMTAEPTTASPAAPPRGRSRALIITAAALLTIGVVIGTVIGLSGDEDEQHKPVVRAPAMKSPAPARVDPLPQEPQPQQPFVVHQNVTPEAAPQQATLEVVTNPPGASLEVDGEPLDTPSPTRIDTTPGSHQVRVALDGYQAIERAVTVSAGERLTLELALVPVAGTKPPPRPHASARGGKVRTESRPSTGYLTVKTIPWSDVYLDGRRLGTTPLADVEVTAGRHTLVFKNPDTKQARRVVTIRPGATTKLSVQLK